MTPANSPTSPTSGIGRSLKGASTEVNRRGLFRRAAGIAAGGVAVAASGPAAAAPAGRRARPTAAALPFKISLAQWSLHRALKGGQMEALDFAKAANRLGFDAIEYVNQFYEGRAKDKSYLSEMKKRAAGEGVWSVLVMIDGEGPLGAAAKAERDKSIENHKKWVEAAAHLGCHAIRVNAHSSGSYQEQVNLAADGIRRLAEFADPFGISVIVENHGGLSSNGAWLAEVMKTADHPRCGTLPDFGNFRISPTEEYDRYKGVAELMPFAKSVSAKSFAFRKNGEETQIDYARMMTIVTAAGYRGYVGVEYEGEGLPEEVGILATKRLLEKVRGRLEVPA